MKLETATVKDMDALCALLNILFEQEVEFQPKKQIQERALRRILENESIGHILVIKQENTIVGMVTLLYTLSTALGTKVALLEDMIIKNEYQNRGFGTKLLLYAKEFALHNGCKRMTLLTDEENIKAHKFYTKNGFIQSTMIPFRTML